VAAALKTVDRRVLWAVLVVALLLHAFVLIWARYWLQTPSVLDKLPPPFYTRVLQPQAAPAPPAVRAPRAAPRKRPAARRIHAAPVALAPQSVAPDNPAASVPEPQAPSAGAAPEPEATDPATAASDAAAPPAFFDNWPPDTRLSYALTGNYRGELHGSARVRWQRLFDGQQARYQTDIELSLGWVWPSMHLTSQGQITAQGLAPQVYEEQIGERRRHARIDQDVQLNNGQHKPRPNGVQDTASQFMELAHRFATSQPPLAPGGSLRLWLARPTGVDEWTYDLQDEETLYLPRLGAVQAVHAKPRRLGNPGKNTISAEIWFAPSLQYLPVRILLTRDDNTSVDLMVDTIEQQ
jgi:hypothetical protein